MLTARGARRRWVGGRPQRGSAPGAAGSRTGTPTAIKGPRSVRQERLLEHEGLDMSCQKHRRVPQCPHDWVNFETGLSQPGLGCFKTPNGVSTQHPYRGTDVSTPTRAFQHCTRATVDWVSRSLRGGGRRAARSKRCREAFHILLPQPAPAPHPTPPTPLPKRCLR